MAAAKRLARGFGYFGLAENGHVHDLDTAIGKFRKLGEPSLHIGHRVMRVEIGLAGEHLIEDEMTGFGTVFLEKIDQVLGIAANEVDQRQCGGAQFVFLPWLGADLGHHRIGAFRNLLIAHTRGFLGEDRRRRHGHRGSEEQGAERIADEHLHDEVFHIEIMGALPGDQRKPVARGLTVSARWSAAALPGPR